MVFSQLSFALWDGLEEMLNYDEIFRGHIRDILAHFNLHSYGFRIFWHFIFFRFFFAFLIFLTSLCCRIGYIILTSGFILCYLKKKSLMSIFVLSNSSDGSFLRYLKNLMKSGFFMVFSISINSISYCFSPKYFRNWMK